LIRFHVLPTIPQIFLAFVLRFLGNRPGCLLLLFQPFPVLEDVTPHLLHTGERHPAALAFAVFILVPTARY
jgi:hypothetical protein